LENQGQVKSKKRVTDHGEVYTNEREVKAMLDLVKDETERIESRFLEPACGNGNFLAEVLERKLNVVDSRYKKDQFEWERYSVLSVSSIYGEVCLRSVRFLLNRNILWGDALDFTNPVTKQPIIFSEWSAVNGSLLKRKDYMFRFLVEKSFQTTFFDEVGEVKAFDEPVKDYPLVHFLKLGEDVASEL